MKAPLDTEVKCRASPWSWGFGYLVVFEDLGLLEQNWSCIWGWIIAFYDMCIAVTSRLRCGTG